MALVYRAEDRLERRLSWDELRAEVSQLRQAFLEDGIGAGDTVAAMLPNLLEAIVAMLATASLGAKWASCSPDFGVNGAVERFGQLDPKLLLTVDGYWYAGKYIDLAEKNAAIAARLHPKATILVTQRVPAGATPPGTVRYRDYVADQTPVPLTFERFPFAQPLFVAFSSGTTGLPKCIVHSAGGVLLQHLKEHRCTATSAPAIASSTSPRWAG